MSSKYYCTGSFFLRTSDKEIKCGGFRLYGQFCVRSLLIIWTRTSGREFANLTWSKSLELIKVKPPGSAHYTPQNRVWRSAWSNGPSLKTCLNVGPRQWYSRYPCTVPYLLESHNCKHRKGFLKHRCFPWISIRVGIFSSQVSLFNQK